MVHKSVKVYLSIILAMLCWALSFVWIKIAYESFNPITTVWLRLFMACIILGIVGFATKRVRLLRKNEIFKFLLLGFFEPFLYFLGESFGMQLVSSTLGSVIISTIPLFTPFAAWYFLKEKVSLRNGIAIGISVIGVALVVSGEGADLSATLPGIALMLLAVFAAIGYSIILKKLTVNYRGIHIIFYQNFFGTILFLPLLIIFDIPGFDASAVTSRSVIAVIELTIFASILAFIFFTYSIQHLGVTISNLFVNMIPVFTAIFAYFILDNPLRLTEALGIIVVISGLMYSQSAKLKFNLKRRKSEPGL